MNAYVCVLFTILFTVYGQLMIKWRISKLPEMPNSLFSKASFLTQSIFTDFYILSGFFAAYVAALFWMMSIKKLPLNIAYPFMSISFVLVFIFSTLLLGEKASYLQIFGLLMILIGVSLVGISTRGVG